MRVTISHNKTQKEVMAIVDRSIDDVFKNVAVGMIQVSDQKKSWNENTMKFSLLVKAGFINAPIQGTVLVTDKDVTVDADLGLFDKLISQDKARNAIESSVKGLLA
jgi:hypothetical protein